MLKFSNSFNSLKKLGNLNIFFFSDKLNEVSREFMEPIKTKF